MASEISIMDKSWGWSAIVAGILNNFLCMGLLRSGGIVFISSVETFNSTRTKAAWIPMISIIVMFLTAPLGTAIARHYSFHLVVGLGGTIAVLGMLVCYFATQIEWVMFGWGVIYGLGASFVFFPSVAAIGYYFKKWRPLGTGLVLAGGGIGSFCLSPLLEYLIEEYKLKGAILITCSLVMNFWVSAFLFKLVATCEKNHKRNLARTYEKVRLTAPDSNVATEDKINSQILQISQCHQDDRDAENILPVTKTDEKPKKTSPRNEYSNKELHTDIIDIQRRLNMHIEITNVTQNNHLNMFTARIKTLLSRFDPKILKNHKFLINCIANALQTSIFLGTITLLPDFSEDEVGLTRIEGAYFVSVTAISDLCVRLFISWLMTKVNVQKELATVAVILTYIVTLIGLGYARTYSLVMICSVLLGACFAAGTQLYFEVLVLCQPPEKYIMAVGFSEMAKAISTVGIACFLGSLKDATGSYAMTFHVLTILMTFAMILWIIEIYVTRRSKSIIS